MPNDVYRWEEGGGLVHHCPICKQPLTHARCGSKCLGEHVEWCSRYHTQLFRKGWSSECAPCKHSEGLHDKRHREIAELLRQLKEFGAQQAPQSPKVFANPDQVLSVPSPLTKKDRKAVRKAAKLAEMPKVITTADLDFVAKTLHPCDYEKDEEEEEKKLAADPDIKLNLYYHKGTSNTREIRYRHLKHKQADKGEPNIDDSELDALMTALKAPAAKAVKTKEERKLVDKLREKVRDDMNEVEREHEQIAIRKGGFWRWASKKAYDRLVANGRIWDQKEDEDETPKRKDSAFSAGGKDTVLDQVEKRSDELSSPKALDGSISSSVGREGAPVVPGSTPYLKRPSNNANASPMGDGWNTVGKAKPTKSPIGAFKLSGNGGLAKLQVKLPGKFAALGLMAPEEESDSEDGSEDDE